MYAKTARVRTSRDWLLGAMFLAPPAVEICVAPAPAAVAIAVPFVAIVLPMLVWVAWPRTRRGAIHADDEGLRFRGRLVARRADIHSANVRTRGGASWLRMSTAFGFVDAELAGADDERAMLAALRLDERGLVARYVASPDRRRSRANVARGAVTSIAPALAFAFLAAIASRLTWPWTVAGFAALCASLWLLVRATLGSVESIWVGADGIRRSSLVGRARFTPFSRIESIAVEGGDVVLRLVDGAEIAWHGDRHERGVVAALAQRIERGLAAHRALRSTRGAHELARGARSIQRWLADLRAACDPERGTYRAAALPADELWKTVESPVAPPTARAGAAFALRRALDDEGRRRLLEVSATCASKNLGRALEAVAIDEAIEERLAAVRD